MELFEKNFNPELYKTDFHWKEGDHDVYRVCHWSAPGCHDSCGILLYERSPTPEARQTDCRPSACTRRAVQGTRSMCAFSRSLAGCANWALG